MLFFTRLSIFVLCLCVAARYHGFVQASDFLSKGSAAKSLGAFQKKAYQHINSQVQYDEDRKARHKQFEAAASKARTQRLQHRIEAKRHVEKVSIQHAAFSFANASLANKNLLAQGRKKLRSIAKTLMNRQTIPPTYVTPKWAETKYEGISITPHNVHDIELSMNHFQKYIMDGPRHYTSVLILTAEAMYAGCKQCLRAESVFSAVKDQFWKEALPSWDRIHNATLSDLDTLLPVPTPFLNSKDELQYSSEGLPVVFFTFPVEHGREFFRDNKIVHAPLVYVVPPELTTKKYSPRSFLKDAKLSELPPTGFRKPDDFIRLIHDVSNVPTPIQNVNEDNSTANVHPNVLSEHPTDGNFTHTHQDPFVGFSKEKIQAASHRKPEELLYEKLVDIFQKIHPLLICLFAFGVVFIVWLATFRWSAFWKLVQYLRIPLSGMVFAAFVYCCSGAMFNRTSEISTSFTSPLFNANTFSIFTFLFEPKVWAHEAMREQYGIETIFVGTFFIIFAIVVVLFIYLPYQEVIKELDVKPSSQGTIPDSAPKSRRGQIITTLRFFVTGFILPAILLTIICMLYLSFVKLFSYKMPQYSTEVLWTHNILANFTNSCFSYLNLPCQVPPNLFW